MTLGEVKRFMEKPVLYDGEEYILKACIMFLHPVTFEFNYSGEIVSVKTRTVMRVPIDKINYK